MLEEMWDSSASIYSLTFTEARTGFKVYDVCKLTLGRFPFVFETEELTKTVPTQTEYITVTLSLRESREQCVLPQLD